MSLTEIVLNSELQYLDLAPANSELIGAELELVSAISRETKLQKLLRKNATKDYQFIIIDSPPSLGLLTLNALAAADSLLVPLQCEYYALEGLSKLLSTVELLRENLALELPLEGILLTLYDARLNLSQQVAAEIKQHTDVPVALGFGIGTPEQVAEVAQFADGVVVGSAIVKAFHNLPLADATDFVSSLVKATKT